MSPVGPSNPSDDMVCIHPNRSSRPLLRATHLPVLLSKIVGCFAPRFTGAKYAQVSEAYSNAVHAVLTKDKKAAQAVSDLEEELVRVTGLKVRRTILP